MSVDVRLVIAAAVLSALAIGGASLAGCGAPSQQEVQKANAAVMAKLNAYCIDRQALLDSLGEGGAP